MQTTCSFLDFNPKWVMMKTLWAFLVTALVAGACAAVIVYVAPSSAATSATCSVRKEDLVSVRRLHTEMVRAYFSFGYQRGVEDTLADLDDASYSHRNQNQTNQTIIDKQHRLASNAGQKSLRLSDELTQRWLVIFRGCSKQ